MWSGSIASIPAGWRLCNGLSGTPDLRNRFIVGAGSGYGVNSTGGAVTVALTLGQIPSHDHDAWTRSGDGDHYHRRTVDDSAYNANGDGRRDFRVEADNPDFDITLNNYDGSHNHFVDTPKKGSGQSHENRPPYFALAYIMRVE